MIRSSWAGSASKLRSPRKWGVAAWSILLVVALSVIGEVSGPGWAPQPLQGAIAVQSRDTAIGSDAQTSPPGSYEVRVDVVTLDITSTVHIKASIYHPIGAPGLRPGVVFLHGAGTADHTRFAPHARALASAGIVAMVPDKRMDTYTAASRDYVAMSDDYEVSAQYLRTLTDVDADRVGVYGESEGAYVAPLVAARYPQTAFAILVSAPVVPPREQATFATDAYLRSTGVPAALLNVIPRGLGPQFPGGALAYADFDVQPYQRQIRQPVLIAYGTADPSMPIVQGARQIIADLAAANNRDYTVRYYEDANHGIKVGGDLVPAFPRDMARWVLGLPDTSDAEPRIAGAQPVQQYRAELPTTPRWYASGDMIVVGFAAGPLIALAALVIGGACTAIAAGWRRLRGRAGPVFADGSAAPSRAVLAVLYRLSGAAALGAAAAWVLYFAYLVTVAQLATNYNTDPIAVDGGWVVTRLAGILAVVALVFSIRAIHRYHRGNQRLPIGAAITISGLQIGAVLMLVAGAYWGIFATLLAL